jgi:hypothetical protein
MYVILEAHRVKKQFDNWIVKKKLHDKIDLSEENLKQVQMIVESAKRAGLTNPWDVMWNGLPYLRCGESPTSVKNYIEASLNEKKIRKDTRSKKAGVGFTFFNQHEL